ncbi:MAG: ABC transporter substrate-binding protein [Fimbriimonadaceae bacterium]|nr:ABC transporter substrate-binding protein [Fimbriimonadaceae bacterium]
MNLRSLSTSLLVLTALWSVSGCGTSSGTGSAGGSASTTPGKKIKIGVSVPSADHGWTAGVGYWAEKAMAMYPDVEWVYKTADKPETQIADIETMMTGELDGLVVLATESAPLTPVAKAAHERGIYIVNVDRGFLEPVADVFIEGDNEAFGRKSAEFVVQKLGGKGKILVLEGIPSTVNTDRVNGANKVFQANPGVTVLESQSGMWNRQKALEVTQAMLLKHPQVDAIWASDDDMALGAEQALKEAGRQNVWILGGAGMKDIVKRVMDKDPVFPANITYPPSMIATGIHLAVSNLRDGKKDDIKQFMPRHMKLDVELITPDNAKDFYFPDSVY